MIVAWLRDFAASASSAALLSPDQPIYIVELGAGSGRFGFYMLRQLGSLLESFDRKDVRVTYVMTDVIEENLEFVSRHPALQPYFESGMLDVARFDVEAPGDITLVRSGATVTSGTLQNPLVCIANYVFDSVRQDIFAVQDGSFAESLVTISSTAPEPDLDDPELMKRIALEFEERPASTEQYDDPRFNAILEAYRRELPNVGFLFPVAALECLRFLSSLSLHGLLLLTADKGYDRLDGLVSQGGPGLALHDGAFSLSVNIDAIGRWVTDQGGTVLRASHRETPLTVAAMALGSGTSQPRELTRTFADTVADFGPDHLFSLVHALGSGSPQANLEALLALLRLAGWDPTLLATLEPSVLASLDTASARQRADIYDMLYRVWEEYYPIGEERDAAAIIGGLMLGMQCYSDALSFFQHSLQLSGERAQTFVDMGACFFALNQWDRAVECAERALALDPNQADARTLFLKLQADRDRRGSRPA